MPVSKGEAKGWLSPGKVLAAVERDHLSGHRGAVEQKAHGAAHLLHCGGAAKWSCAALALEVGLTLPQAREHGSGANRIDANARGERLGKSPGCRPQRRFGDGVGEELRGEAPDALIDHIDHASGAVLRQRSCKFLDEENRRAEIDIELGLPASPVKRVDRRLIRQVGGPSSSAQD